SNRSSDSCPLPPLVLEHRMDLVLVSSRKELVHSRDQVAESLDAAQRPAQRLHVRGVRAAALLALTAAAALLPVRRLADRFLDGPADHRDAAGEPRSDRAVVEPAAAARLLPWSLRCSLLPPPRALGAHDSFAGRLRARSSGGTLATRGGSRPGVACHAVHPHECHQ